VCQCSIDLFSPALSDSSFLHNVLSSFKAIRKDIQVLGNTIFSGVYSILYVLRSILSVVDLQKEIKSNLMNSPDRGVRILCRQ